MCHGGMNCYWFFSWITATEKEMVRKKLLEKSCKNVKNFFGRLVGFFVFLPMDGTIPHFVMETKLPPSHKLLLRKQCGFFVFLEKTFFNNSLSYHLKRGDNKGFFVAKSNNLCIWLTKPCNEKPSHINP